MKLEFTDTKSEKSEKDKSKPFMFGPAQLASDN